MVELQKPRMDKHLGRDFHLSVSGLYKQKCESGREEAIERRNEAEEEERRGINVCRCWITGLRSQIENNRRSYVLFSTTDIRIQEF